MAKAEIRITALGAVTRPVRNGDIIPIVADGRTYNVTLKVLFKSLTDAISLKEDSLGLPPLNGYILQSDTLGNRSWVQNTGGVAVDPSTGLELITSVNGDGWRLIGEDVTGRVNIGAHAVDMTTRSQAAGVDVGAAGQDSFAAGIDNTSNGDASFTVGSSNLAQADYSFAAGYSSNAYGIASLSIGFNSSAYGTSSISIGKNTIANGNYSAAIGIDTAANNIYQTVIGKHNDTTNTDTLLEVGNGTSSTRSNAFEVYLDGTGTLPTSTTALIDSRGAKAIPTIEWIQANAGGSGELIKDGNGYRINGQSTGPLGTGTVNLSIGGTAEGDYSLCAGYHTSVGYTSQYESSPPPKYATALGRSSVAKGDYSVAIGRNVQTHNDYQTALGKYNDTTNTDTLLEVGNGASSTRSNAFEVYLNGTATLPTSTTTLIDTKGSKAIPTIEYLLSAEFAASIPTANTGPGGGIWSDAGILKIGS